MSEPCQEYEERLVSLLYEDGDEGERARTRGHMAECAACRREFEELGGTRELLSSWPNVANAPRMVYVHEPAAVADRLRGWVADLRDWRPRAMLAPIAAAAVTAVALVGAVAVLDVRVADDGSLRLGRLAADSPATEPVESPVTREEFQEGLAQVVTHLEGLLESRDAEQWRLLLAALDERMEEQGLSMSRELRGAVQTAFADIQGQHENDLGLVFSAIDEMGLMTSDQLQRMNAILGSLAMAGPAY